MRKRVTAPSDQDITSTGNSGVQKIVKDASFKRSQFWRWGKRGLLALFATCVLVPFMLYIFPEAIKQIVYSHRMRVPFFVDFSQPGELHLNHTINMYLTSEEGLSLGVWHTVPESKWKDAQGKDLSWYEKSLGDGNPVFIYLHGNGGTRAATHRVGVGNVLSALGYHVLIMDYRGFADSTGEPTEAGVTADALYLYHWVKARSGNSLLIFWGHSLGTGVATNTAVKLLEQGIIVDGVILEGAFLSASQRNPCYPFYWFYWKYPSKYLQCYFSDMVSENRVIFPNEENLKKMRSPLLILHAEDDHLAPIQMAQQMYKTAQRHQNPERVKMVSFTGSLGYLHNGLFKDPLLPDIIEKFVLSL